MPNTQALEIVNTHLSRGASGDLAASVLVYEELKESNKLLERIALALENLTDKEEFSEEAEPTQETPVPAPAPVVKKNATGVTTIGE